MTLYIVAQVRASTQYGVVWDLQGVFDTVEKAEAACHGDTFLVSPIELNHEYPIEAMVLPGTYVPATGEPFPIGANAA